MNLTPYQEAALILRGMAAKLPQAEFEKLEKIEAELRRLLSEHGDLAKFAISLVGAELAAELE